MKCDLLDLGCHVSSGFWGLVGLVPWWAWLVIAIAGLGVAYRLGGWPAVAALCFGYGVFWGGKLAKSVSTEEQYGGREVRKPGKVRTPTARKKGETAADRWEARE